MVLVLLGVFSFYITPRDFIHHFAAHEDTRDEAPVATKHKGLVISEQHRHCEWLQWEVDTYLPSHQVILRGSFVQFAVLEPVLPLFVATRTEYSLPLRAPPAA